MIVRSARNVPLVPSARRVTRARSRPFAIALWWAWHALVGWIVARPLTATIAATYGHHVDGDAPLRRDGGLALLDWLVHTMPATGAIGAYESLVVPVLLAFGLVPLAIVLAMLSSSGRARLRDVLPELSFSLPRLALLFLVWCVLAVVVGVICAMSAGALSEGGARPWGEPTADKAALSVIARPCEAA